VSDTTVVSATTQETDIPGVVRSRVKYALAAAVPALVLFTLFGGDGMEADYGRAAELLAETASPDGLVALTWGILTAIAVELLLGLAPTEAILYFDPATDTVGGALIDGIAGYLGLSILILLIVAGGHLMRLGGALDALIDGLKKFARESVARAEAAMWGIVFSLNAFITINTAAEIAAGPVISRLGKRFKLHPYRRANMLRFRASGATDGSLALRAAWLVSRCRHVNCRADGIRPHLRSRRRIRDEDATGKPLTGTVCLILSVVPQDTTPVSIH
jgi:Na+/H+ antiporter NhaC